MNGLVLMNCVYDYLVFYKVDEIGGSVKIYRVLHGKRNMMSLL
jgi:plasmid stabilization system protein ParE